PVEHLAFYPELAARLLQVVVVHAAVDLLPGDAGGVVRSGAEQRRVPVVRLDLRVVLDVGILDADDGQLVGRTKEKPIAAVVPACAATAAARTAGRIAGQGHHN